MNASETIRSSHLISSPTAYCNDVPDTLVLDQRYYYISRAGNVAHARIGALVDDFEIQIVQYPCHVMSMGKNTCLQVY